MYTIDIWITVCINRKPCTITTYKCQNCKSEFLKRRKELYSKLSHIFKNFLVHLDCAGENWSFPLIMWKLEFSSYYVKIGVFLLLCKNWSFPLIIRKWEDKSCSECWQTKSKIIKVTQLATSEKEEGKEKKETFHDNQADKLHTINPFFCGKKTP